MDQYSDGMLCQHHTRQKNGSCLFPATHHVELSLFMDVHGFFCQGHVRQLKYIASTSSCKCKVETVDAYIIRCTEAAFKQKPHHDPWIVNHDDDDFYGG
jgi:hypothetical protein